jgi:uncharacterized protein DUF2585
MPQAYEPLRSLITRRTVLATIALVVVFVGLLLLEARPWWCKYGIGLITGAWDHCTSQHFVDPYSLTHALHGIIFYWALTLAAPKMPLHWRMFGALVIEVSWELLENSPWVIERYRQQTASLDYTGDSILNSIGDLVATAIGFAFASQFSWKVALAAFVAVELILLITIRDNLTLNVLMLFLPIESIKTWQMSVNPGV